MIKEKNWINIWNSKESTLEEYDLEDLIKLSGFDSGAGTVNTESWIEYSNHVKTKLGIQVQDSVFEYGCGSGSFLYTLNLDEMGGCDYSQPLIDVASSQINGEFFVSDVLEASPSKKYDWGISNSVFHYFKDLDYAEKVVIKMLDNSNKGIAILDVIDEDHKDAYELMRNGSYENYKEKYKGLEHLAYKMEWWSNILIKYKNDLDIIIERQVLKNYPNGEFRYNVYIIKR